MSSDSNRQDVYKYDGSGKSGPCEGDTYQRTSSVKDWHPDYSLSSPEAREWYKQNQATRCKPLDLNSDGTYTTKKADCLETIAERDLRDRGHSTGKSAIDKEVAQIIALNHDKYTQLDENKEFLGNGWRLRMPGRSADNCPPPRPQDNCPPAEVPQPQPRPQPRPDDGYSRNNDDSYRYQQQPRSDQNAGAALAAGLTMLPLIFGAASMFNRREDCYDRPYYGGYNGGYNGGNNNGYYNNGSWNQQQHWRQAQQHEMWRERHQQQQWQQRHHDWR